MTYDEELLCRPWNRDLFVAWKRDEITWSEAVFLAKRVEFHTSLPSMPDWCAAALLWMYDLMFEPRR